VLSPELAAEIKAKLPLLSINIKGVYIPRRMCFLRRPMRWGGVFPAKMLRLFRHGSGKCEDRWMDEHIRLSGETVAFQSELIDDNLNDLTWWTDKHNRYASREVVDLLNLKYQFAPQDSVAGLHDGQQASIKRWVKENVYARLPGGLRAGLYFLYRYVVRLGFLDGREGAAFHLLQGFWYRFLVDAKLREVEGRMTRDGLSPESAIAAVLGLHVERNATPPKIGKAA
jgi:hypothetical protein